MSAGVEFLFDSESAHLFAGCDREAMCLHGRPEAVKCFVRLYHLNNHRVGWDNQVGAAFAIRDAEHVTVVAFLEVHTSDL
jgi:hypothetical protein